MSPSPKALSRSFKVIDAAIWTFFFTSVFIIIFVYLFISTLTQFFRFASFVQSSLYLYVSRIFFFLEGGGGVGGIKKRGDFVTGLP